MGDVSETFFFLSSFFGDLPVVSLRCVQVCISLAMFFFSLILISELYCTDLWGLSSLSVFFCKADTYIYLSANTR